MGRRAASTDLVRSISSTCMKGFWWNLAQLFTIMRRSVMRKNQVPRSKVKVTLRGQRSNSRMTLSGAYLLHVWRDFDESWHNCSSSWDGVSCAKTRSLGLRSRSHLEVKGYKNEKFKNDFVRSISSSCMEWFWCSLAQLFTIMRGSVMRKNQVPRSKVKVTLRGQRIQ